MEQEKQQRDFKPIPLALSFIALIAALAAQLYQPKPDFDFQTNTLYLFTKDSCTYSHQAKAFLDRNGIYYVEMKVDEDSLSKKLNRWLLKDYSGSSSVPLFYLNNHKILGYNGEMFQEKLSYMNYRYFSENDLLSESAQDSFHQYDDSPNNKAFAQAVNGVWGYWQGASTEEAAIQNALDTCKGYNKAKNSVSPCEIINVNGRWK